MDVYRFRIVPESAWRTPWQSDTLAGMLCGAIARTEGNDALQEDVIGPALAGRPPFVLSDAFPGEWLPVPAYVRLADWPAAERKSVKKAKWVAGAYFPRLQAGYLPGQAELIAASGSVEYIQLRNTIGREDNSTSAGGGLFPTQEAVLDRDIGYLTVYARIAPGFAERFGRAVEELATGGYGADRSAGKGQFRLGSEIEPWGGFDADGAADGCLVLSTFQPAAGDPVEGAWQTLTKYGKLGPDFGIENVFKRPLILLRPGAGFRTDRPRPWLGRAIPMRQILSSEAAGELEGRGIRIVHWAFGLAVPLVWPKEIAT